MIVSQFNLAKQVGASEIGFDELNGILFRKERAPGHTIYPLCIGDIEETLMNIDMRDFLLLADNLFDNIDDGFEDYRPFKGMFGEFLEDLSEGYSFLQAMDTLRSYYKVTFARSMVGTNYMKS
jgi:hypothetical protein